MGDEHLPKHFSGDLARLSGVLTEMNASAEAVLKGSFPTATRVDLGFDHNLTWNLGGSIACLLGRVGYAAFGSCDAELLKQLSGLEFVDIHSDEEKH